MTIEKLEIRPVETAPARLFTLATLALVATQMVALMAFAAVVNPRSEFPITLVEPVVLDEARVKLETFQVRTSPLGVLVLGSSRTAGLGDPVNPTLFNFAAGGGSLRDDLALLRFVLQIETPERIIIGVDSFQFTDVDASALAHSAVGPVFGEKRSAREWLFLLHGTATASYQADAVRALAWPAQGIEEEQPLAYADNGVQSRPVADRDRAAGAYDFEERFEVSWRTRVVHRYPVDAIPDSRASTVLEDLVREAVASGAAVQIFLTPFHAEALRRLVDNPGFVALDGAAHEALLKACDLGAEGFDFTNVTSFGGLEDGFYDPYHPTPENTRALAAALQTGRGRTCEGEADVG